MSGILPGFTYRYPTSGSIRIGSKAQDPGAESTRTSSNGDEFIITTKQKCRDGNWIRHPLDATIRHAHGSLDREKKLTQIPVRLAFNSPELSMVEQYSAFSTSGIRCTGNGATCGRSTVSGRYESGVCPGPSACDFGRANRCQLYGQLLLHIEGQDEWEPPFSLWTGSVNAIGANRALLQYWHASVRGMLAGLPFVLKLVPKTSFDSTENFHYPQLEPNPRLFNESLRRAQEAMQLEASKEIDRAAGEEELLRLQTIQHSGLPKDEHLAVDGGVTSGSFSSEAQMLVSSLAAMISCTENQVDGCAELEGGTPPLHARCEYE